MSKYDESIGILKGQIDIHKRKITLIDTELANLQAGVRRYEIEKSSIIERINNLSYVLDDLHMLQKKDQS